EVNARGELRLLTEDHLEIFQPRHVVVQPPPTGSRACLAVAAGLGVRQVNQPILLEIGRKPHVQQSTLPSGEDLAYALQGFGNLAVEPDQAQTAGTLSDQHLTATRQKRQRPGTLQPTGNLLDADAPLLALVMPHFGSRDRRNE